MLLLLLPLLGCGSFPPVAESQVAYSRMSAHATFHNSRGQPAACKLTLAAPTDADITSPPAEQIGQWSGRTVRHETGLCQKDGLGANLWLGEEAPAASPSSLQ